MLSDKEHHRNIHDLVDFISSNMQVEVKIYEIFKISLEYMHNRMKSCFFLYDT